MTEKRCRDCGVCHYKHPDANKSGGMGRILAWRAGRCPACCSKRREYRAWAAAHVVAARLDPADNYLSPARTPEQATLEEVFG